jgi:ferric-dicitrate binding protein FerR (iron transport regulator)
MEFQELSPQLLARYLAGECTPRERRTIDQWLKEDPENEQKLEELRQVWELAEDKNGNQKSQEPGKEWEQLKERLDPRTTVERVSTPNQQHSASIHSTFQKVVRVAAILLIAGLFGILSYSYWSFPESNSQSIEPVLRKVSTSVAQRANLTLGDGTKVILNADTKIEYPQKFASDIREVHLRGEAYFDVVRNPEKPFIIYAGQTRTRVLGTSFSVRSYPEERQVQVVVEEGRVSFSSTADPDSTVATLTKNKLAQYSTEIQQITTKQIDDMELYLGWKEGALKFKETAMRKVAKEIERRYGVQVFFDQKEIAEMSLTAFLKSRSISNVLDVIATSLTINYRLEDNDVIFYRK